MSAVRRTRVDSISKFLGASLVARDASTAAAPREAFYPYKSKCLFLYLRVCEDMNVSVLMNAELLRVCVTSFCK